jgi:hypothetical protein
MSNGKLWPLILCSCLIIGSHSTALAQQPTLTFTFTFPGSQPEHYAISVDADGHASYESDGKLNPQVETTDSFRLEFTVSQANCARIFDLARRAHYFQGEIDSKKKGLASTGAKTLAYKDSQRGTQATYNYSPLPPVQELTQFFQNLSTTLEFGRRLEYYHRYQKLALDDELKRMEDMAKRNNLEELAAIEPILKQIAADSSVINPVRARALRLLAQASPR